MPLNSPAEHIPGFEYRATERFGKWWGHFSLIDLMAVNFLTLITEFAAISLALSALGISPYISVPVSAVGLTLLVVTGSYLRWERIVIALCLIDLTWFVLAFMVRPDWATVAHNFVVPTMPARGITSSLIFLIIAIVGTTIAPWQLFFQQSCVAEKRLRFSDLKWARLDKLIGAAFTVLVAGAMMLVDNCGYQHSVIFKDPAQLAVALSPLAGHFVRNGVLLLMVNAAVLGTTRSRSPAASPSQHTFVRCCFPPSIVCRLHSSHYMENRMKTKMKPIFGPN
jgi:Mn2+/Fe2+ NRAMP family transporter